MQIDTKGLDRKEVFLALWNKAPKTRALGVTRQTPTEIPVGDAADILRESKVVYFDCPNGVAKIDLTNSDGFDPTQYDHVVGKGAAAAIINELKVHA